MSACNHKFTRREGRDIVHAESETSNQEGNKAKCFKCGRFLTYYEIQRDKTARDYRRINIGFYFIFFGLFLQFVGLTWAALD